MPQSARELDRFLELPYHIVLMRDEGGGEQESWTARVEELPGCEARDRTADGAARAISKAMEDWLAAALEKGATVPEPRPRRRIAAACSYGYPRASMLSSPTRRIGKRSASTA